MSVSGYKIGVRSDGRSREVTGALMWKDLANAGLAWVRQNWHHPLTPAVLAFIAVIFIFSLFSYVDFSRLPIAAYVALGVALSAILGGWAWTQRLPRPKNDMVALAVAIRTEEKKQQQKIKQDFIDTLRELVSQGALRYRFAVVVVPEFVTMRIRTDDDAQRYARKAAWHFMLYGRARLRTLNNKEHHVLNLKGLVRHRPLTEVVSRQLSMEFRELMPRDIKIEAENDLLAFDFTAEYMAAVAQYIIGIASFLSSDLDYAQSLYEKLQVTVTPEHAKFPPLQKIRRRLPTRLSELFGAQASLRHRRWREDRDPKHYDEIKPFLDRLQKLTPSSYTGHLLRTISHFVSSRDVDAAIAEIRKCKELGLKDTTWRFSYAFLLAYRRELQQAYKQYQAAFRGPVQSKVLIEVEEFMLWVFDEEPDKVQLHYCLGLVNHLGKNDPVRALEEFTAFLEKTSADDKAYRLARKDVEVYVRELRQLLDTERLSE